MEIETRITTAEDMEKRNRHIDLNIGKDGTEGKTVHDVKILRKYFLAVKHGRKPFELRIDDRDYKEGDILHLHEITSEPAGDNTGGYTGRSTKKEITYVLRDCKEFGLMDGFCILGLGELI